MSRGNIILLVWLAFALAGWIAIVAMVRITWMDDRSAREYERTHRNVRGYRQIATTYLRLSLSLLAAQTSFLLGALAGVANVENGAVTVILTLGSLAPGLGAALWYRDRQAWAREDRRGMGRP